MKPDAPLTERQRGVLQAMRELGASDRASAVPPSAIAYRMGLPKSRRSRGPWAGWQNPAQRIISSLRGLEMRGLIRQTRRPDGMSGTAYYRDESVAGE